MAYRSSVHGCTPAQLMLGRDLRLPIDQAWRWSFPACIYTYWPRWGECTSLLDWICSWRAIKWRTVMIPVLEIVNHSRKVTLYGLSRRNFHLNRCQKWPMEQWTSICTSIVQALVIANYKFTTVHEHHFVIFNKLSSSSKSLFSDRYI